eukprot:5400649-Pyramimonas_sp.AAC.1
MDGQRLLVQRWTDVGEIMAALGCDWFFGVSCRCPPHSSIQQEVPHFPYEMMGPRTASFGAVA